jgi:hypothetical protein
MCGLFDPGEKKETQKTTGPLDKEWESAARIALERTQAGAERPFEPYDAGKRVAPWAQDQVDGFKQIRDFQSSSGDAYKQANGWLGAYGNAPASRVSAANTRAGQTRPGQTTVGRVTAGKTKAGVVRAGQTQAGTHEAKQTTAGTVDAGGRIIDENGYLGKISDYMNPYLDAALEPALRDIQEGGMKQRQVIGARAQSAGAFGDARQGVVEGEQMRGELRDMGDLSATERANAYNQAMGYRTEDMNRKIGVDTGNRDARLTSDLGNADRSLTSDMANVNRAFQNDVWNRDAKLSAQTGNRDIKFQSDVGNVNRKFEADVGNRNIKYDSDRGNVDRRFQSDLGNVNRRFESDVGNANRQFASSTENARLREQGLDRKYNASNAAMDQSAAYDRAQMAQIAALLASGDKQQGHYQNYRDAEYENYVNKQNHYQNQNNMWLSMLGRAQLPSQTTTSTPTANPILEFLGSAAGSYFGA